FDVDPRLRPETADEVYDALSARLAQPEFRPRALLDRFRTKVLATAEAPRAALAPRAARAADGRGGPGGGVRATIAPDNVVDMEWDGWASRLLFKQETAYEVADLPQVHGIPPTAFSNQ